MDRLQAMRVFARVARLRSFARAAHDLNLSRASVSESVAALERHLGARLLMRTTRRVSCTEEGSNYLQRCERILAEVESAEMLVRGGRSRPQGKLRVDVPIAFGQHLLLPALPDFTARYPDVELELRFNDRVVDLVAERVDVAVRVGAIQHANFVARRIATTRRLIVASHAYLSSHGIPQRPEDLRRHRLLGLLSGATGRVAEWRFKGAAVRNLKYAVVFSQAEAQLEAAIAGVGLAQTLDLLASASIARGRLATVLNEYAGDGPPISVVHSEAAHRSAKVRVFAEYAAALLQRWRDAHPVPSAA
jgi:LysR family transcriptional regulator, regulator for bpeEF and oprC